MKIFANKKIWKKIVIIFLIISVFSFTTPEPVSADIGGTLMSPIISLLVGLADGFNTIINSAFLGQNETIHTVRTGIENPALNFLWHFVKFEWEYQKFVMNLPSYGLNFFIKYVIKNDKDGAVRDVSTEYQKSVGLMRDALLDDVLKLPEINLTPYQIFSNKNDIFSVNIFNNDKQSDDTIISNFKNIVRDWYTTLRLISIVCMMSVLVYIGIRILLSSTADSKAKYKQMLGDWFVAIFLVFSMHYIMIFSNVLVESISEIIDSIHIEDNGKDINAMTYVNEKGVEGFFIGTKQDENNNFQIDDDSKELVERAYKKLVGDDGNNPENKYKNYFYKNTSGELAENSSDAHILFWPADDFMEQARMYTQKAKTEDTKEGDYHYIGYGLIYVVLTAYAIMFSWVYLKRLIYMIFLTLISPLVALTYPIDKVKDGQAQAFNFWMREYFYNLLIQPLHLLLYMLLIGSAMRFAAENPIYVIVALGFMVPAEKLVKSMFGFKGETPGAIPGLAAGALMMHATRKLFGTPPKSSNSSGSQGSGKGEDSDVPIKINSPKPYSNTKFGSNSSRENQTLENAGGFNNEELDQQGTSMLNRMNENAQNNTLNDSNNSGTSLTGTSTPSLPNNSIQSTNNNEIKRIGRLEATRRAAINGARGKIKNTFGSGKWWGNTAKKGIKVAGGALLGATGAGIGGIATIVGGDPSKALENMSLGGLAGYKFGSGGTGAITDKVTNSYNTAKNAIDKEYYAGNPDEYARKQMEEYIKKWKDNQENISTLKLQLGNKAANELINRGGLNNYIESGFTDARDIATGELFLKNHRDMERKDAIDVLQINKQIAGGDFTKLNPDDQDKWRRALREKFEKGIPGISEGQLNRSVQNAEGYLNEISSIRTKIQ